MFPVFQIGPLAVQAPGLILLGGLWIGLWVAEMASKRIFPGGESAEQKRVASELYNVVMIAIVAGLLGARLVYAARALPAFLADPLSLFSPTVAMLDPLGGLVVGLVASGLYGYRKGLRLWTTLDLLAPGLAVLGIAVGLSLLAAGDYIGTPTRLPWGVNLWGEDRHPTQVYFMAAFGLIFAVTWPWRAESSRPAGTRFWLFATLAAAAVLIIERGRADSPLTVFGLRSVQVAAWVVLAAALPALRGRLAQAGPPADETS